LYRHSITIEFIARRPKKETPTPFCELRVTIFTKLPVSKTLIRKRLLQEIAKLAWTFPSIRMAVAEYSVNWYVDPYKEYIGFKKFPKPIAIKHIVLGFEYNRVVSDEEAIEFIAISKTPYFEYISNPEFFNRFVAENIRKFLDTPIYYGIFYEPDGTVKEEYNDWVIRTDTTYFSRGLTRRAWLEGDVYLSDFEFWKKLFLGLITEVTE